jgi:CBS domain-containing protein
MHTAREIMSENVECADPRDSLVDVARKMRDLGVGALPICGEDERLRGMITDRDIVMNCVANGGDPNSIMVEEYAAGDVVTIGADDSVEEVLRAMTENGVRRLPVIDGEHLIGIVSQADVARNLSEEQIARLVEVISKAPPR